MPILGVNNCLPILHMSKIMVHIYTTENNFDQFAIGYMINPSLHINRVFIEQVQKCLGCTFSIETKKTIRLSAEEEYIYYDNNNDLWK